MDHTVKKMGTALYAFCQAVYKGIEGSEWEVLYHNYRDMSMAARATTPSESQKAKALWVMKAAEDKVDEFYDSVRKENILGRKSQRPNHSVGQSFEVRGESISRLIVGSRLL